MLDNLYLKVNYMSSLRTFIDLQQFYDLNQLEGIRIKSVKLQKNDYNDYQQMHNYFDIDCKQKLNIEQKQLPSNKSDNSDDDQENIDIGNLSFSNEMKTDQFLNNIMASKLINLNFTNIDKEFQNDYNKVNRIADTDNRDLHHARLVLIDGEPLYENNNIIIQENERKLKQNWTNKETIMKNKNDKIFPKMKSPFTKYLIDKTKERRHEYRNRIHSCSTRSNIKPDLISSPNRIKTLSKFHKIK